MSSNSNIVPFAQPEAPSVSFGDMQQLATAVARSGLFGIKTPDQALALMALAQAEGRHPATVARDYHIINGSPSKKAEAMQRDFLMAGGKIEWRELTDEAVEATFSHPLGGTATIRWDAARCKQAGLVGGNHQKFPRQMKRSRVVSEGVRTVWPLATSGFYVPEEVAEFAAAPALEADTRTELDRFAAAKPAEIIDAETGEVFARAALDRDARSAAAKGTEHFRAFLVALDKDRRIALRDLVGTRDEPGELTVLARRTDDALREHADDVDRGPVDAFGLPLTGERPHSPAGDPGDIANQPAEQKGSHTNGGPGPTASTPIQSTPAGEHNIPDLLGGKPRPAFGKHRVSLPERANSDDWEAWRRALWAMIEAGDDRAAIRHDNRDNLEIFEQVDEMAHNKLMRTLEPK
jgi:hypothetical protein